MSLSFVASCKESSALRSRHFGSVSSAALILGAALASGSGPAIAQTAPTPTVITSQAALDAYSGTPGAKSKVNNGNNAKSLMLLNDGTHTDQNPAVYTVNNSLFTKFKAVGGNGSGGGAGFGGAIFVDNGVNLTLNNVSFIGNTAQGGLGGAKDSNGNYITTGGSLNGLTGTQALTTITTSVLGFPPTTSSISGANGKTPDDNIYLVGDGNGNGLPGTNGGGGAKGGYSLTGTESIGGNGGIGGNGQSGWSTNPQLIQAQVQADLALASAIAGAVALGAEEGEAIAGLFTIPLAPAIAAQLAQAIIDGVNAGIALEQATGTLAAWQVANVKGSVGLGGDGGAGGQGGQGASFFGGGAGGAGGNGGAGGGNARDGFGGAGGAGGAGGFGAGGGSGGNGGAGAEQGVGGAGGYQGFGGGVGSTGAGYNVGAPRDSNGEFVPFGGWGGSAGGGAIFIREGGSVTLQGDALFENNNAMGGGSKNGGGVGDNAGSDVFMMTKSTFILDANALDPTGDHAIEFRGKAGSLGISDDTKGKDYANGVDGPPMGAGVQIKSGLVIFGANNTYSGQTQLTGGVLRAEDAAGLAPFSTLVFKGSGKTGAVFETDVDFTRFIGNLDGAGQIYWDGSGGFSSTKADGVKVTLSSGMQLTWGADGFVGSNGSVLIFGSKYAEGTVDFTNDISLNGKTGRINVVANEMVYDPASHTFKKADAVIDSATLSGVISDGEGQTGSTLIINDGTSGTLIMTAVNTYTGTTTVMGGTLALSGDGSIATSRQVDLHNTTIFDISGVTANSSLITTLKGDAGVSVVLGAKTLEITSARDTFEGVISGDGGVKIDGGTQTLMGVNTYTGKTQIASGATLALTGAGSIAASASVNADGTFDISGTSGASILSLAGASSGSVNLGARTLSITNAVDSFDGVISGTGGVIISGGTQTFNGKNTYTGLTEVKSNAKLVTTGAIVGGLTNAGVVEAEGTLNGVITNSGSFKLIAALAGNSGFTNNDPGTVEIGYALTGITSFTNNSKANRSAGDAANAVTITSSGSLGTNAARVVVTNTVGAFSNAGTIYASSLSNSGGTFISTDTIDASTSVTNAATMKVQGVMKTPTVRNTGAFSLTGDLAGPISTFTNNNTGTVDVGAHALTLVTSFTNSSSSVSAVTIATNGSLGTDAARTTVSNTAGTFTNAGTIYANTLSNTGGVLISTDTVNASTSVTNAATMKVRGVMKTSTVTNTGAFILTGDLAGPITTFTNNNTGTVDVGAHALTLVTSFTNNSSSASAVTIATNGSLGTDAARTTVSNTAGTFTNAGKIYATTLGNTGGTFISTDTIDASTSVTNSATMNVQGVMKTPSVTNTGAFSLTGDLAGPITTFTNDPTGTVDVGAHALTLVTTFTNNSSSASAVTIAAGGSMGTSAGRTTVSNTAGTFTNDGTIYANTLSNTGGTFVSTDTIDASVSVTNSAIMNVRGVLTSPMVTNTGAFALTGDLAGPITTFTNNATGTVDIGAHALTLVTTFTNNSTSSSAVRIASGGSMGTSGARTAVSNTAGGFVSNGTIFATTLSNTETGTFESTGTIDASGSVTNDATMRLRGVLNAPLVSNTGSLLLTGDLSGQITSFINDSNGTVEIGVYALTGVTTFTNNSAETEAVTIASAGSLGTSAARTVVNNTAGRFSNAGTVYATTLTNAGGIFANTGTVDAQTLKVTGGTFASNNLGSGPINFLADHSIH